jgi:hypothetical protein
MVREKFHGRIRTAGDKMLKMRQKVTARWKEENRRQAIIREGNECMTLTKRSLESPYNLSCFLGIRDLGKKESIISQNLQLINDDILKLTT